jgi:hypothetical protein
VLQNVVFYDNIKIKGDIKMKVKNERVYKWTTHKNYTYWFCYFTKYDITSRLIQLKIKKGEKLCRF